MPSVNNLLKSKPRFAKNVMDDAWHKKRQSGADLLNGFGKT